MYTRTAAVSAISTGLRHRYRRHHRVTTVTYATTNFDVDDDDPPTPSGRFNQNHPSLYTLKWAVATRESSEYSLKSCYDPASNSGPSSYNSRDIVNR